jgi:signal transduction histidine kinase
VTDIRAVSGMIWRIAVIDDSADDRAEVRRLLLRGSDRRYSFAEAETGTTGIALVLTAASLPDCVLLDYNLPDLDALDVLTALAGADGLPVCPVVVLTGGAGPEARRSVLRAGAQDYVGKDWLTPPGLTWVVENAIERLAMARQLLLRDEALRRNEKTLSDADRRKDEFIATLAHELRNPLAPVRTGLRVLRLTRDAEAAARTMDMMERQLGQMTRLIDDLLDISRVTSGKVLLRFKRVAVRALIDAAAEAVMPVVEAGGHSLTIDLPAQALWLDADHDRLVQVIGNLLNNSAKYSLDGGQIRLAARPEGDTVVIEISDAGLGIPKEMLSQVFDMFTQVNSALDRSQGGLGIGLALVKRLVGMHGGTIVAESPGAGAGSTFTIRLPAAVAAAPLPDAVVASPGISVQALQGCRVLVVDDNADGADMLAMMLEHSGHQTRIAYSGLEALEIAASFRPEVIFLDIGLPGLNGYDVARRFRATPALSPMLLVALTGWGSEEDRRRSKEAGFDIHLTKPVEPAAIDDVMARFGLPPDAGVLVTAASLQHL